VIEIVRSSYGSHLNQRKYILDIFTYAALTGVKPAKFPLPKNLKLSNESGDLMPDPSKYRRLIGIYFT